MKKKNRRLPFRLLSIAATLWLLNACTQVEPYDGLESPEILYQTISHPALTKASTAFANSNRFVSYAYYLPAGKDWDTYSGEALLYLGPAPITYQAGVWKDASQRYYWPKTGRLSFFAWSLNANHLDINEDISVTCSPATGIRMNAYDLTKNRNTDFMVADPAKDKSANEAVYYTNGVPTLFRHELSKLEIMIKSPDGTLFDAHTTPKLRYASLRNCGYLADYTQTPVSPATCWNLAAGATTLPIYGDGESPNWFSDAVNAGIQPDNTPALLSDASGYSIVLPQAFPADDLDLSDNPLLEIGYTVTSNYGTPADFVQKKVCQVSLRSLFGAEWEKGKQYTLTIILGLQQIKYDPCVNDWDISNSNM